MDTEIARRQMVDQQVRAWAVTDATVLALMANLEREDFVTAKYRHLAYADMEIPLGHGQKMMMPVIEGRLLQALEIKPDHSVLEIGTGSGYLTACLATLGASVTSIDIYDDFLQSASDRLSKGGIENVQLARMDATQKLPEGQFDAIAVTGSLAILDDRFTAALKPGGRMFVIIGDAPVMDAQLVELEENSAVSVSNMFETSIQPLVNSPVPSTFSF
jgi:protein-L-isoaspartate(D-aspartate) O-methyltransferase